MKPTSVLFSLAILFALFFSCKQKTENDSNALTGKTTIQVIQFHSTHRCVTCNSIEKLTLETLKSYPNISFQLINVDDSKNEKIAEEFEATGTSLFLYNSQTGKKKDLTDFAFMNAKNKPEEFKSGLKKEIEQFN